MLVSEIKLLKPKHAVLSVIHRINNKIKVVPAPIRRRNHIFLAEKTLIYMLMAFVKVVPVSK